MSWFLLALGASVLWGLTYAVSGYLSRTVAAEAIMLFSYLIGTPIYVWLCWKNGTWGDLAAMTRWPNLGWGLLMVLGWVAGNLFILWAFKLTDNPFLVSAVEISYPLFVLGFGLLLFRMGALNLWSAAGLALIAAGLLCLYKVKV